MPRRRTIVAVITTAVLAGTAVVAAPVWAAQQRAAAAAAAPVAAAAAPLAAPAAVVPAATLTSLGTFAASAPTANGVVTLTLSNVPEHGGIYLVPCEPGEVPSASTCQWRKWYAKFLDAVALEPGWEVDRDGDAKQVARQYLQDARWSSWLGYDLAAIQPAVDGNFVWSSNSIPASAVTPGMDPLIR